MDASAAQLEMTRLMTGYWISQAVYVAAKLGIADRLVAGPLGVDALAAQTGSHDRSLYRLLRALASVGVFAEDDRGRFELTPLAEFLRSDVPGSQRALVLMMGEEHYRAWGDLLYSVQTGEVAFDRVYGKPVFDYLSEHPEQGRIFDAAMTGIHGRETAAVIDAYDFAGVATLADIGGGNGSQLRAVLEKHPEMHGILFDLPAVIERTAPKIEAAGLADRCGAVAGDFFESVPAGADAYLLRHIIHDWDDSNAATILTHCRQALPAAGRVLLVESVIPPGNEPFFGKLLDLTMLVIPGGLERTAEQYEKLLADAGLKLKRIVPTATEVSVLEAVAL